MNVEKAYAALECVESYTERKRILDLNRIFVQIRSENENGGRILELFSRYQQMYGLKGLKRKYYVWLDAEERQPGGGVLALADGRKMKRAETKRENPKAVRPGLTSDMKTGPQRSRQK